MFSTAVLSGGPIGPVSVPAAALIAYANMRHIAILLQVPLPGGAIFGAAGAAREPPPTLPAGLIVPSTAVAPLALPPAEDANATRMGARPPTPVSGTKTEVP